MQENEPGTFGTESPETAKYPPTAMPHERTPGHAGDPAATPLPEEYDVPTRQMDPGNDRTRQPPPRPRWVLWLVIGVLVVVVLFLAMHLLAGGGGGPMNHGGMSMGMPVTAAVMTGGPT